MSPPKNVNISNLNLFVTKDYSPLTAESIKTHFVKVPSGSKHHPSMLMGASA